MGIELNNSKELHNSTQFAPHKLWEHHHVDHVYTLM